MENKSLILEFTKSRIDKYNKILDCGSEEQIATVCFYIECAAGRVEYILDEIKDGLENDLTEEEISQYEMDALIISELTGKQYPSLQRR